MKQENRERVTRQIITYSLNAHFGDERIINSQVEDETYYLLNAAQEGTVLTGEAITSIAKGIAKTYNVERSIGEDLVFGMLNVLGIPTSRIALG
jgi:hypothetical protein